MSISIIVILIGFLRSTVSLVFSVSPWLRTGSCLDTNRIIVWNCRRMDMKLSPHTWLRLFVLLNLGHWCHYQEIPGSVHVHLFKTEKFRVPHHFGWPEIEQVRHGISNISTSRKISLYIAAGIKCLLIEKLWSIFFNLQINGLFHSGVFYKLSLWFMSSFYV